MDGVDAGISDWDGEDAEGEAQGESYPEPPEEAKLFVGNLPYDMDSEKLAHLFEEAGIVEVAEVWKVYRVLPFSSLLWKIFRIISSEFSLSGFSFHVFGKGSVFSSVCQLKRRRYLPPVSNDGWNSMVLMDEVLEVELHQRGF